MSPDPAVMGALAVSAVMTLEYGVGRAMGKRLYTLADTLSNLGTGMGQLAVQAMLGFSTITLYGAVESRIGLLELSASEPLHWLAAYAIAEVCFYFRHRAGHEVHLFWAIHSVHHQSPEFNIGVGQRVGWLQWAQTAVFILPLALAGVPMGMFAAVFAAIHLYNLLLHTTLIDRLGPLESVLMTPSHHRVHHGRNPQYLDRNYGFTVIFLDRLLGTYQVEDEAPAWGTNKPLDSWSPVQNNLAPWADLWAAIQSAPTLWRAVQVPFRHPAWNPVTGRTELPDHTPSRPVPTDSGSPLDRLATPALYLLAAFATAALVQFTPVWSAPVRWAVGLAVVAATMTVHRLSSTAKELP